MTGFAERPSISTREAIIDRLLSRTFNGQSRYTTAEMTGLIDAAVRRGRQPVDPARSAELFHLADKFCPGENSPTIDALNALTWQRLAHELEKLKESSRPEDLPEAAEKLKREMARFYVYRPRWNPEPPPGCGPV